MATIEFLHDLKKKKKKVHLRTFTQVSEVTLNAQELIIHASAVVVVNKFY